MKKIKLNELETVLTPKQMKNLIGGSEEGCAPGYPYYINCNGRLRCCAINDSVKCCA